MGKGGSSYTEDTVLSFQSELCSILIGEKKTNYKTIIIIIILSVGDLFQGQFKQTIFVGETKILPIWKNCSLIKRINKLKDRFISGFRMVMINLKPEYHQCSHPYTDYKRTCQHLTSPAKITSISLKRNMEFDTLSTLMSLLQLLHVFCIANFTIYCIVV